MPKFEKKKKKKKMTQIHKTNKFKLICFSHYKYHTDIKQPKFSTEIRLIRFLVKISDLNIFVHSATTHWTIDDGKTHQRLVYAQSDNMKYDSDTLPSNTNIKNICSMLIYLKSVFVLTMQLFY